MTSTLDRSAARSEASGFGSAILVLLLCLGVALHFLTTIEFGGTRLRVGSSDLVLPFLALFALWCWQRTDREVLRWRAPGLWRWLLMLSSWILVSLLVGYAHSGGWQTWALVNKTMGWFVLLSYFVLGGWCGAHQSLRARDFFLRTFLLVGWMVCGLESVRYIAGYYGIFSIDFVWRLEGFFANPNAFGYAVAVLIVLQAPFLRRRELFSRWVHILGLAFALFALLFSGSRSAMVGLTLAWPILLLLRHAEWRDTLKAAVAAWMIAASSLYLPAHVERWMSSVDGAGPVKRPPLRALVNFSGDDIQGFGLKHRMEITRNAISAWRGSPVLGIGLGSFYWEQQRAELNHKPGYIHNTALWLLTETGLVGLLLFLGFFLACARGLILPWRGRDTDPFQVAAFGALLVCVGASVGMEALYQRHLWFLVGWALVVPSTMGQADAKSP